MKKHSNLFIPWLTSLGLLFFSPSSQAAEIETIDVIYERDNIKITTVALFEAGINNVFNVLADYNNYTELSGVYKEATWLSLDDSETFGVGFTVIQGCIIWFCKTIERTEEVKMNRPHQIITKVIDDDLNYGETTWIFSDKNNMTSLDFEMNFSPNFWVPPVIGPWAIEQFISYKLKDTLDRIEAIANALNDAP